MPTIGHSRPDLPIEYLCYNYELHSIIYRVEESANEIFVVRVLHTKMFKEPGGNFQEQF